MKEELNLFKALSDEMRLRIMVLLSERELCVCQIEWALGLAQAKVSRHLNVLRNAGLVQGRREGLWIFYSLTNPRNELERVIHTYLKEYFTKRHDLFKKDLANMKKCVVKPLEKLTTIRR
ncbi:MAG: metalloregulator ArsR/SmtB family transcription factor [Candidatus Omnitrophica bacterium]|nr:metalloregulator ArsR/SmtB family transcription factor [Candidatus Omnitrophota bacterium]